MEVKFTKGLLSLLASAFTIVEPSNSTTMTISLTPPPYTCPQCAVSGGSATVDLKVVNGDCLPT